MRGAKALFGAIGAICAIAPAAGFAADTPAAAAARAGRDAEAEQGVRMRRLRHGILQARRLRASAAGPATTSWDSPPRISPSHDIGLVGQRLPSSVYAAGVPILYYYDKNFSKQTDDPYPGVDAQVNFVAMRQTDYGALIGYVNLRAAGQLQDNENGDLRYVANNAVNGSILQGLVDQAWVRLGGLEVGIQPSMFGFARWGYSISPGYSSLVNTPAVSYTYRVDNVAGSNNSVSASIALEDRSRRDMDDGVLADYGRTYGPTSSRRRGSDRRTCCCTSAARCMRSTTRPPGTAAIRPTTRCGAPRRRQAANIASSGATCSARRRATHTAASCSRARLARGAIGYLGIPFFATDYVVGGDGDLHETTGYSAVASYEHLWTPTVKSSVTYSIFGTSEASNMELLGPNEPMWFDVKVRGALLEGGIEDMVQPGLTIGAEAGYTWTTATGNYAGASSAPLSVSFPNVAAYVRKFF